MFTVIIAEKKHFDAIEQNRLYFTPFLNRSPADFVFCKWNPNGKTFWECVPDLVPLVGRRENWRAIILNEDSHQNKQNPFDIIQYNQVRQCEEKYPFPDPYMEMAGEESEDGDYSRLFEEWKEECQKRSASYLAEKEILFRDALRFPLQRLVACLCHSLDHSDSLELQKGEEWASFDEPTDPEQCQSVLSMLEYKRIMREGDLKKALWDECVRGMLSDPCSESKQVETIGIALPSEVYCVSTRETEKGFYDAGSFWEDHTDAMYSDFVPRNMYFNKMKFIVSDILPKIHQNYSYSQTCFLHNILLLATNEIPTGVMVSRRLYQLQSENDENALSSTVSTYACKLDNTIDLIDQKIEKIKKEIPLELSDNEAKLMFCENNTIPVTVREEDSPEDPYVKQSDYGYFYDSHGDEINAWAGQHAKTKKALEDYAKQPRRALKRAVDRLGPYCEVDVNMIRALNQFQMEDVKDYTETHEEKMIAVPIVNIFNLSDYKKRLDQAAEKVKKVMMGRMKKRTVFYLGLICLALFFFSFVPLFTSNYSNPASFLTALILGGSSVASLAVTLFITVILMRIPLKNAINDYNQIIKEDLDEIQSSLTHYSDYLSHFCGARRGYKVVRFSKKNLDKYDHTIRILMKHKMDIQKVKAELSDSYGNMIHETGKESELAVIPYNYDFTVEKNEYHYDPPYQKEYYSTIDFLEKGNRISVPSGFVNSVNLRMEEIYDE